MAKIEDLLGWLMGTEAGTTRQQQIVQWINECPEELTHVEMMATIATMMEKNMMREDMPDIFCHMLRVWAHESGDRHPQLLLVVKPNGSMAWTQQFDAEDFTFEDEGRPLH